MTILLSNIERNEIEELFSDYLEEDAFYDCYKEDGYSQIRTLFQLDAFIKELQTISKDIHKREEERQKLTTKISENLECILKKYESKGDICELLDYVADDIRKNYY